MTAGGGEGAGVIGDNEDDGDGEVDSDGREGRYDEDGGDDGDDGDNGDDGEYGNRGGERSVWLESFKNPGCFGRKSMHMHILHCEVIG